MAPTHWSDLGKIGTGARGNKVTRRPSPLPRHQAPSANDRNVENAASENPHFANLLKQREQLQQRMQTAMVGGQPQIDTRDAARYQVPSMAQRRADYRAWEDAREQRRNETSGDGEQSNDAPVLGPYERTRPQTPPNNMPSLPFRSTTGEAGSASPLDPGQWMQQHDQRRARGRQRPRRRRTNDDYNQLDERLQRARSSAGNIQNPIRDLDRKFADADRRLADEGMDSERRDLEQMKNEMGLDNFNRPVKGAEDIFSKLRSVTDRSRDAGERVEQDWLSRRDAIGGNDMESYMRPLRDVKDRVLSMSGRDFDARSEDRRNKALELQRQRRRQEQADDARRARALENRKAKQDAV